LRVAPRTESHPATSLLTWGLAFILFCWIDAAITRTDVLWGPTAFENSGGVRLVFPQTYQVARKIYAPARDADIQIALLGNSRVVLAVREQRLERAVSGIRPGLDVSIANLGVFGSFIGETEMLARHLGPLDPSIVVLAIGAPDLIRQPSHPPGEGPMELLRIGWRDGPIPASSPGERVDRWLRTVWPLYRFREFAREAILDRVLGRPDPGPPPENFATRAELFAQIYGERAEAVHAAYRVWERDGGLDAYARYLEVAGSGHLARRKQRARSQEPLTKQTPAVVVFDALLARLARAGRPGFVLLMPENPILADDTAGVFHRPGLADKAALLAKELAAAHGIPVVDARRWLGADRFLDFDHPIVQLEVFEQRLAEEIVNALEG
jgi:hypothetical protein